MKRTNLIISSVILALAMTANGCATNKVEPQPEEIPAQEESPAPVEPEPEPEEKAEEDEYARSTKNLDISMDIWAEDKKAITHIISELDTVMAERNYDVWLNYLDQESINYWSKKNNLQKAASRHPIKGIKFNSLRDYFMMVFIPSRTGLMIEEIRYDSENQIRAVVVKEEGDTTYYNFQKVNGKWKVHLPENPD